MYILYLLKEKNISEKTVKIGVLNRNSKHEGAGKNCRHGTTIAYNSRCDHVNMKQKLFYQE